MANARNGQTLLGGSGGEQRTGTTKENTLQFSFIQFVQQLTAQCNGAAAAAGTAGMDILHCVIENQSSAVCQLAAQRKIVSFSKFQKQLLAQLSQITGDDQIEIRRCPLQILHMGTNRFKCCRRHAGTHIVCVFNTQIFYGADGATFDSGSCTRGTYQRRTGTGDGPLGGRCPLSAITQRETVLAL